MVGQSAPQVARKPYRLMRNVVTGQYRVEMPCADGVCVEVGLFTSRYEAEAHYARVIIQGAGMAGPRASGRKSPTTDTGDWQRNVIDA